MTSAVTAHPDYDPAIPARQAAAYMGIHYRTLLDLARQGDLAAIRSRGGRLSFRLSALNRHLDAQTSDDHRPTPRLEDIDWGA